MLLLESVAAGGAVAVAVVDAVAVAGDGGFVNSWWVLEIVA